MPNIAATAPTHSRFPTGLDQFPVREDGTSVKSIISADALNRIESALYLAQTHAQPVIHTAPGVRRRVTILGNATLGAPAAGMTVVVSLTAGQKTFLGTGGAALGSMLLADAVCPDQALALYTMVAPILNSTGAIDSYAVQVYRLDGTNLPAGAYRIRLTVLGA